MNTQLNLYQKKHKLILGGLGVAALLVGVIVMLINGSDPESIIRPLRNPVIFYALMFTGLALTLYLLRFVFSSLRHPKPRVILSASGATVDGFSGRFRRHGKNLQVTVSITHPCLYCISKIYRPILIRHLRDGQKKLQKPDREFRQSVTDRNQYA